eukprot:NODE_2285_length_1096_cov_43.458204_g2267_i0.p1 GENE.NODE_2285_length_1096_cov_43.458204_g2267_i0~~NODE_2285_length_1096_cov_43.458204_g2267_i0.p1  ORF type:complete len:312 (-),score=36.07 NODE_2285_length_1096_cov_43.458204_g2267_i0:83-1018(-)
MYTTTTVPAQYDVCCKRVFRRGCLCGVWILVLCALVLATIATVSRHWVVYDNIQGTPNRSIGLWRQCTDFTVAVAGATPSTTTVSNCQDMDDYMDALPSCADGQKTWIRLCRAFMILGCIFSLITLIATVAAAFVKKIQILYTCCCIAGGAGLLALFFYAFTFIAWISTASKEYCTSEGQALTYKLFCSGNVDCGYGYATWFVLVAALVTLFALCLTCLAGFPRNKPLPQQVIFQEPVTTTTTVVPTPPSTPAIVQQPVVMEQVIMQEPQVQYEYVQEPQVQYEYVVEQPAPSSVVYTASPSKPTTQYVYQ